MSSTAAQLIEGKGGAAKVAAAIGKTPGSVRVWRHRNAIPREAWPEMLQAFPDVTLDVLIEAERLSEIAPALPVSAQIEATAP